MRKILSIVFSAAVMLYTGWLFAIENYFGGATIMAFSFFIIGFLLSKSGYGFLYGTVFAYIAGSVITAFVINNYYFYSKGEIQTIAYVSDRNVQHSTSMQGGRQISENKKTHYLAYITYPTYGVTKEDFIRQFYQETINGYINRPIHPLADTVIVSFAINRPQMYKILNAIPSSEELAKYKKPVVLDSDKKILEGDDAMEYIKICSTFR